ncbi:hypothetical protein TUMSATVNIG1_22940 [Vibrio nigripulchritudo]|uniref:hypothetical protein n=1 Tax=Vibrio nigripulchritudo TaxID=28173 RepID=UPI00190C066D|nr:hypothetical protein [Vibrio nigripulchritudo]BCL70333.1 hypothetical protein VNTUMSATTG_22700 [Vibrio nigripulchritudo]BDU31685.1 hypothetical protein TUMSATVNIG1_22940 [Vibrio nigripulchritudo]
MMKIKNALLVSALTACGLTATQVAANPVVSTNVYAGAFSVNTNMEESVDEMITAKLKASFFSSAATYMELTKKDKYQAKPAELQSQLEAASKNSKYSIEERQSLANAYSEVGMVINYLKSQGMKDVEKQSMTFCRADGIDASSWPGIDDVITKYGKRTDTQFTRVQVSTIYTPDMSTGNCSKPGDWNLKLKKNAKPDDLKAVPSGMIAYSGDIGNSSGELVYILENNMPEDQDNKMQASYESFTFYQTSADDNPEEGIFRRYRVEVPTDKTETASKFSSNVICNQCETVNESFKVESRREYDHAGAGSTPRDGIYDRTLIASTSVVNNALKSLTPGFVKENSAEDVYLVEAILNTSVPETPIYENVIIDRFKLSNSLVVGRYDSDHVTSSNDLKLINLIGQFGLSKVLPDNNIYPNSFNIDLNNNSFQILESGSKQHSVSVTNEDEKRVLTEIDGLNEQSVSFDKSAININTWNSVN